MKFLIPFTFKKAIILLVVLFLVYVVFEVVSDPQGFIDSIKRGYEAGYKAGNS